MLIKWIATKFIYTLQDAFPLFWLSNGWGYSLRGWTILFHPERDIVLVVINVVIEGWRILHSDLSTVLWIGLEILVVVKVKDFVNLFCFSSLCRRFDEWTMCFAIAIHLLIACILICPLYLRYWTTSIARLSIYWIHLWLHLPCGFRLDAAD